MTRILVASFLGAFLSVQANAQILKFSTNVTVDTHGGITVKKFEKFINSLPVKVSEVCPPNNCKRDLRVFYPQITGTSILSKDLTKINKYIKNYAKKIRAFYNKAAYSKQDQGSYQLTYQLYNYDNKVSIVFSDSRLPCCAANESEKRVSLSFDLSKGKPLVFTRLVQNIDKVNDYIWRKLKLLDGKEGRVYSFFSEPRYQAYLNYAQAEEHIPTYGDLNDQEVPKFDFTNKFFFNNEGELVVFFNRYEVGPRSSGFIEIAIPRELR